MYPSRMEWIQIKAPLSLVIGYLDQAAVRSDHDHRRVHAVISQALTNSPNFSTSPSS